MPPMISVTIGNRARCWYRPRRSKVRFSTSKPRCLWRAAKFAMLVAENRYMAEDALAEIGVEYQPLPAVTDLERALALDSPQVHDGIAGNVAARVHQKKGDYEAARHAAALVLRRRFRYE